ncbi:hypothetical protein [Novosphingobium sp. 9]|uniref:hypothetical protein n=1 Tax=Novosphingobium sp. 9 TaxID=2025349 RepID=UPI0021B5D873|nr:hypothetical protein [Novosphingobium sp. 9]
MLREDRRRSLPDRAGLAAQTHPRDPPFAVQRHPEFKRTAAAFRTGTGAQRHAIVERMLEQHHRKAEHFGV